MRLLVVGRVCSTTEADWSTAGQTGTAACKRGGDKNNVLLPS